MVRTRGRLWRGRILRSRRSLLQDGGCAIGAHAQSSQLAVFWFDTKQRSRLRCRFQCSQYERIKRALPASKRLAILTISATSLDEATLHSAGIASDTPVFGLPRDSHFVRAILDGYPALDIEQATREWVTLACECQQSHPDIGGWLFECANMPPYAKAVAAATGLDVYDAIALGTELRAGTVRATREAL